MAIFRGKPDNRLRPGWAGTVPDAAHAVAWSPDGKILAVAAVSGPVTVFAADSGKVVAELAGHGFGTTAVAFAPTGDRLVTAGQDGKVRVWDTQLWQERAALPGGAAWVERLAFHPSGLFASAGGKSVRIWDAAGNLVREFAGHKSTVADLAWKPNSTLLAVAPYGGVAVYDPASPDPVREYKWRGAPLALAWSPDAKLLAHGNQDATVHFWYAESGEELQMSGYPNKVTAISWDYTSRFLATGGGDRVCVWDCGGTGPAASTPTMLDGHAGIVSALAYQRRGFLLAAGDRGGRVRLWQPTAKKAEVGRADGEGEVVALAWSPDDVAVAVGFGTGTVAVYRV